MKIEKKKHSVDIHRNPCAPGRSRIPIDTCCCQLEEFLKKEIILTKVCACPACDYKRHMLRELQNILAEYKKMRGCR